MRIYESKQTVFRALLIVIGIHKHIRCDSGPPEYTQYFNTPNWYGCESLGDQYVPNTITTLTTGAGCDGATQTDFTVGDVIYVYQAWDYPAHGAHSSGIGEFMLVTAISEANPAVLTVTRGYYDIDGTSTPATTFSSDILVAGVERSSGYPRTNGICDSGTCQGCIVPSNDCKMAGTFNTNTQACFVPTIKPDGAGCNRGVVDPMDYNPDPFLSDDMTPDLYFDDDDDATIQMTNGTCVSGVCYGCPVPSNDCKAGGTFDWVTQTCSTPTFKAAGTACDSQTKAKF